MLVTCQTARHGQPWGPLCAQHQCHLLSQHTSTRGPTLTAKEVDQHSQEGSVLKCGYFKGSTVVVPNSTGKPQRNEKGYY